MVESASGPAARVGLAAGDIILRINDMDINSPKEYEKVVQSLSKDKRAAVLVMRGGSAQWVLIKPSE